MTDYVDSRVWKDPGGGRRGKRKSPLRIERFTQSSGSILFSVLTEVGESVYDTIMRKWTYAELRIERYSVQKTPHVWAKGTR